jgi:hypothetical protein
VFQDDDAGYLAWVHQHPDGFVVNTERRPSPSYLMLHRADCAFITRPSEQGRWTVAYIKVCAAEVADWSGGRVR